jgi:outer membrane protein assembly factor BamB
MRYGPPQRFGYRARRAFASPLGGSATPWPPSPIRRRQVQLYYSSLLSLVFLVLSYVVLLTEVAIRGRWILLLFLPVLGLGQPFTPWWIPILGAVPMWYLGLPVAAVCLTIRQLAEFWMAHMERRLDRESFLLTDFDDDHTRPARPPRATLAPSRIESVIRSVLEDVEHPRRPEADAYLAMAWRAETGTKWLPPCVAAGSHVVYAGSESLVGLERTNGRQAWRQTLRPGALPSSLVYASGLVLAQYRVTEDWDVLAALEPETGTVLWQRRQWYSPHPVGFGSDVLVADNRFTMKVRRDGTVIWTTAPVNLGPIELAAGGPYAVLRDGQNRILVLDAQGRICWRARLDPDSRDPDLDTPMRRLYAQLGARPGMMITLATDGEIVVVAGERAVVAYEAATGDVRWVSREGSPLDAALAGNRVFLAGVDTVRALDTAGGQLVWQCTLDDDLPLSSLSASPTSAWLQGRNALHRLRAADGERISLLLTAEPPPATKTEWLQRAKSMRAFRPPMIDDESAVGWFPGHGFVAVHEQLEARPSPQRSPTVLEE